jgi:hypothetical protein
VPRIDSAACFFDTLPICSCPAAFPAACRSLLMQFIPMLLYFTYMATISYGFFCLTGTIGFYACYWFTRKIYGAIKID